MRPFPQDSVLSFSLLIPLVLGDAFFTVRHFASVSDAYCQNLCEDILFSFAMLMRTFTKDSAMSFSLLIPDFLEDKGFLL